MAREQTKSTVFDKGSKAKEGIGHEPAYRVNQQVAKNKMEETSADEVEETFKKHNIEMPKYWPELKNGRHVTHVWRALDSLNGMDFKFPKNADPAMSQHAFPDFRDAKTRAAVPLHISKASASDYGLRPFLSFSEDLEIVVGMKAKEIVDDAGDKGYEPVAKRL